MWEYLVSWLWCYSMTHYLKRRSKSGYALLSPPLCGARSIADLVDLLDEMRFPESTLVASHLNERKEGSHLSHPIHFPRLPVTRVLWGNERWVWTEAGTKRLIVVVLQKLSSEKEKVLWHSWFFPCQIRLASRMGLLSCQLLISC